MRGPRTAGRRRAAVLASVTVLVALGVIRSGSARESSVASESEGRREQLPGAVLLGEWWTPGKEGRVRFSRHADGSFRGTLVCCKPSRDVNNPDPRLRSRSILGILLIWDLKYVGDGEYEDGHVYNPRDGNTYGFEAEMLGPDTLEITGYLGVSWLGQSQLWTRAKGTGSKR